ncbi:MAG: hypothetical protein LBT26_04505 [Clostridiales Family XIII bacterium]|jgi:hypothetical protein|nr:hypothetical protein [Clostridiales Family XIII bacterium]
MDRVLRWFSMPIGKQMYNIGSEVNRAIKWKNKDDGVKKLNFAIKAIEMLGLTKNDPKNFGRFDELHFYECELIDYILGENIYQNNDKSIMKSYNQWEHCC